MTETEQQEQQWVGPEVKVSCRVYIAKTVGEMRQGHELLMGFINRVSGETCDIVSFKPGAAIPKIWLGCRHVDDPALETHKDWFTDSHFGVYRLAEPEEVIAAVRHEQTSQAQLIADLAMEVAELKHSVYGSPAAKEPDPPKRGPGRPRKPPVES